MLFLAFLKCQGTHSEDVMTVRTVLLLAALLLPPRRMLARAAPASAALIHTECVLHVSWVYSPSILIFLSTF